MMEGPKSLEKHEEKSDSSIADLLPRFYEASGDRLRYQIVRSIPIDGHDVAWMRYDSVDSSGHTLNCACDFAEDVGWMVDNDEIVDLAGGENCTPKQVAQYLRLLELKREYSERFKDKLFGSEYVDQDKIPQVILDLLEKSKRGEFIAETGFHLAAGHVFPETVADIVGMPLDKIHELVVEMNKDGLVYEDAGVIYEYLEPEETWPNKWRFFYEGYTGIASLPEEGDEPGFWQIAYLAPNDRLICFGVRGPELALVEGERPGPKDFVEVEAEIRQGIEGFLWDPMSQG